MGDIETFLAEVEGRKPLVCVVERDGRFEVVLDFEDRHDARVHHVFGVRQWADEACERMNTNARGDIPRLLQIVRAQEDALRKAALREKQAIDGMMEVVSGVAKELDPSLCDPQGNEDVWIPVRRMRERLAKLASEKQAVIDGMTRAITAEGKANEAFYAMQAERDALRERVKRLEVAAARLYESSNAVVCGPFIERGIMRPAWDDAMRETRAILEGVANGTTETK